MLGCFPEGAAGWPCMGQECWPRVSGHLPDCTFRLRRSFHTFLPRNSAQIAASTGDCECLQRTLAPWPLPRSAVITHRQYSFTAGWAGTTNE